jgi:hypothetical protein
MTIADFEEKIAFRRTTCDQGYYPPKSIVRTPGNERRVTVGDLSAARNDVKPGSSNDPTRPCLMYCGIPAALPDVYCADCRSKVGYHSHTT